MASENRALTPPVRRSPATAGRRSMKKHLFALGMSIAVLTACSTTSTQTYELQFDSDNTDRQADLAIASMDVVRRRIEAHGSEPRDLDIERAGSGTTLVVKVQDAALGEALTTELTAPFVLDFMVQSAEGEPVDAIVEEHGSFRKIGLGGSTVDWVLPEVDPSDPLHGRLLIGFTQEGIVIAQNVFKEHSGKFLGLFVRGQLAAKIKIEDAIPENAIVISGLPNQELAEVFADDVNVGLHVTFVPVQ